MGITASILHDVQRQIAPSDETLDAVRNRRDEVLGIVEPYPGALRTYASGSIAHRTANDDTDADGGVVLDRRYYPEFGPDGDGEGPADVDLIMALTQNDGALWIPNLERPGWDPSDPECHTRLMTAEPATLRRTRAKIVRLAKAWNKQYAQPGLCAFNITALALACITEGMGVATGLAAFFTYAAKDLKQRLTPDPAGVSPPIKLLIDRNVVVSRLDQASKCMEEAFGHEDDETAVREALSKLYWKYVQPPAGSTSKVAFANILRGGNAGVGISHGLAIGTTNTVPLKTTRAFGSGHAKEPSAQ